MFTVCNAHSPIIPQTLLYLPLSLPRSQECEQAQGLHWTISFHYVCERGPTKPRDGLRDHRERVSGCSPDREHRLERKKSHPFVSPGSEAGRRLGSGQWPVDSRKSEKLTSQRWIHTGSSYFSPGWRLRVVERRSTEPMGMRGHVAGSGGCSVVLFCAMSLLFQGCWAITGFAKMCLAVPLLPLGFLCVSEPRYTDFRSKEPPSMP